MTVATPTVPEPLTERPQWVVWKYEIRNGQLTKVPYDVRTGGKAAKNNPATWCSYGEAVCALETGKYSGIGFVFFLTDGFAGVDLDKCIDPKTDKIHPDAQAIIDLLDSYTEISPSGTGVKIFLEGSKPGDRFRTKRTPWGENIEFYDTEWYFTVTGQHIEGTPLTVNARHEQLTELYERFFPARLEEEERTTPRPETVAIEDDEELLEKARAAGGSGEEFVLLFDRGIVPEGKSPSEADWQLLRKLAFWTGGDADRMVALFERSALYRPPPEKHAGYVRLSVNERLKKYHGDYYDPAGRAREAREAIERRLVPRRQWERWKGLSGQTDRAVYDALLLAGAGDDGYGAAKERGVEIKLAYRELAERAGISRRSVSNSLKRLEERELVERVPAEKGKKQGRILVLFAAPEDEKYFVQSEVSPQACPISLTRGGITAEGSTGVPEDSLPYGARLWRCLGGSEVNLLRLRYGTADEAYLRRLGKGVVPILEALLEDHTRVYSLYVLAKAVDRRKDSVKRSMPKLVHAGLVEELDPERYRLHPDFESNFEQELEDSGIVESERLQKEKHAREREAWRTLPEAPAAEPHPPREETATLNNATERRDRARVRENRSLMRRNKELLREAATRGGLTPVQRKAIARRALAAADAADAAGSSLEALRKELALLLSPPEEREAHQRAANEEADVILLDEYRAARGDVTPGRAREAPPAPREVEEDDGLGDFFDEEVGS